MPYTIDKYNGTTIAVVEDGTIDTTLDIKLIGKNYAGYGEVQNENFVHLLENFAGANQPPRPISGQLWYDTANKKLKFYDSTTARWKTTGGAEVSPTIPAGLSAGDFWYDSANKQVYISDGSNFILVGPQGLSGFGTTEMKSITVLDTAGNGHAIIQAITDDDVVFIISTDQFTLGPANPVDGFTDIKKGITLANVNASTGVSLEGVYWGTASDANRLGGIAASEYVRRNETGTFGDEGFTVGNSNDLEIKIDTDGTTALIQNVVSENIVFKTRSPGPNTNIPLRLIAANILPGFNDTSDIGSDTLRFKRVYAGSYYGSGANLTQLNAAQLTSGTIAVDRLSGTYNISVNGSAATAGFATNSVNADFLKVGSVYSSSSIEATSGTVAVRTNTSENIGGVDISAGSLKANYFVGTATSALFADLAEKYLADQDYEVGTVVCVGGDKEVTACNTGDRAFGAVSASPAYMMNSGLEGGTYIALKGRVPVKVVGPVIKGDKLIAGPNGCAGTANTLLKGVPIKAGNFPDTFAVALETSDDEGIKLIEAIIL
jgi:hypothetical protein